MKKFYKKFVKILLAVLMFFLLSRFDLGFSQNIIEKWTKAESPKLITGKVTIPEGKTVIIEPGVVVAFQPKSILEVHGILIACGLKSDEDKIIFTSNKDMEFASALYKNIRGMEAFEENKDEWSKISFLNDKADRPSILENCVIRYSGEVIECENAYPILQHILIERNRESKVKLNGLWNEIKRGYNDFSTRVHSLSSTIEIPDSVCYNNKPFNAVIAVTNIGDKEITEVSPYFVTLLGSGLLSWKYKNQTKEITFLPGEKKEIVIECNIRGAKSGYFRLKTFTIGKEMRTGVLVASRAVVSDSCYFDISPPPSEVVKAPEKLKAPQAPSDLRIVKRIEGGIVIAWNDQSENESGFELELKKGSEGKWEIAATIAANVTSFKIMGMESREPVFCRIRAFNKIGKSRFSNIVEVKPIVIPEKVTVSTKAKPFYKKWWFWTASAAGTGILTFILVKPSPAATPLAELPVPPGLPSK